jgi:HEAT repeat protein
VIKKDKKSIIELIEKVQKSDDLSLRRQAIIKLGYEKDKSVYDVLIEQLNDSSASICHAAVISLGRYGNPAAIEEVVKPKIFRSTMVDIRWAAVITIGKLGDHHIIDYLLKAVSDSEWIVRNQAVTEIKVKIREIIESRDIKNIRILVRLLVLDDTEIVNLAIEGLNELGEESFDCLLETLKSPSEVMRKNASIALGRMKANVAVDLLIELTDDQNTEIRKYAVEAIGNIGDKRAIEPLVQSLRDNVEVVQQQAMKSLISFGKLSINPLLNALTHEKNKYVLRTILLTLGEIGEIEAVPALINYLRSSYFVARVAAAKALIRFGIEIIDSILCTLSYNQSDITTLLKDAGNRSNPPVQLRAIKALSGLEEHRAVSVLKKIVSEGLPEVQDAAEKALIQIGCSAWGRCMALIVLREIGDESVIPYFIKSLKDDSNNVRLEAVRALAKIDGPNAIRPLISVVEKDRDPYIRFEALRHLRSIGVGYPEVLKQALLSLHDSSRDVRSQAARLLGNFQDHRSIKPLLIAMADVHWSVRESVENALINFGSKAVPNLLTALGSSKWTTRFRTARLLGEIGDERAIEPLEKLLEKSRERKKVRLKVQEALLKLKKKKAA